MKAVIFDFGGVLMRTGNPMGRREWESRLNLEPGTLERAVHGSDSWMRAQRGLISMEEHWANVAVQLGVRPDDLPQLKIDYFRDDRLDRDLIGLIDSLRAEGLLVGLLSNDAAALEEKLRDELDLYRHFDAIVISAKIGVMKPDPSAYQAMCSALSVNFADCVFIDDNQANIDAAAALGIHTIHYEAGMDVRAALETILKGES